MPHSTQFVSPPLRPLFRWVGGKQKLLSQILPHVPQKFGTYFEPFFGGGALYFNLNPKRAVIGDKNPDLVNFLSVVKDSPHALIKSLARNVNSSEAYYAVRAAIPANPIPRAARFQYLINLGFSGVYRVNRKGKFNVPYSKEENRRFFDGEKIWAAHRMLQNTQIYNGDFEETVASAVEGDFVYFDPPYTVAHDNNGFLEYNENIFQWQEQEKLALLVKKLVSRGVRVIVSNANHASVRALYDSTKIHYVRRQSTVSAESAFRGEVQEILFVHT
jgi:DNA adenine methylase